MSTSIQSLDHAMNTTSTDSCDKKSDYERLTFCSKLSIENPTAYMLGIERNKSDLRQLGGLLVILGMGASFSALALNAVIVEGMEGYSQVEHFRLPLLIASIIQIFLGMVSMAVGFLVLLSAPISHRAYMVAKIVLLVVNLGPISFVITIIRLAQGASEPPEDNEYIPLSLDPDQSHIRFVAAMGILGLISVCGSLIGGLTVVCLNLLALLSGQIINKHRGYYLTRFAYYSILQLIGGLSQLALGAFLAVAYGTGPYQDPVHVAVYTVFFPCLSIFVGTCQTLHGAYGFARAVGWDKIQSEDDSRFLFVTLFTWFITMIFQIIVQPSYAQGSDFVAEGPTYACVYIGNFVVPAWLEWMLRSTPTRIRRTDYSLPEDRQCKEDFLCKLLGLTEGCDKQHLSTRQPIEDTTTIMHSVRANFESEQRQQENSYKI